MAEYTPGPWRYEADDGSRDGMLGGSLIASNGHVIASATSHDGEYNQEQLATDLCLAAAAPVMLEALEWHSGEPCGRYNCRNHILAKEHLCRGCRTRAAIAQARGEAKTPA